MDEIDDTRTPAEEDRAMEAAVLRRLLALHPAQVSFQELLREMGDPGDFAQRDATERAVRDLVAAGLLHPRGDDLVLPSLAALRFDELLDG